MTTVRRLERRIRTAWLPHTCLCCGTEIKPGQRYVRIFFLQDGKPTIFKYHAARPAGEDECVWKRGSR